MRRLTLGTFALSALTLLLLGCDSSRSLDPLSASDEAAQAKGRAIPFATLTMLPSLGSNGVAYGVDAEGTVIVGQSFDRAGYLYAVKWTLVNGAWVIATLPYSGHAAYSARGVSDAGDAVGYFASTPRV